MSASPARLTRPLIGYRGYRGLHGAVIMAKQIVRQFYNQDIKYSYYSGCSTGGRQCLKEAQMFPEDFDGIIAGAPA
jgi:feruloyl esterase